MKKRYAHPRARLLPLLAAGLALVAGVVAAQPALASPGYNHSTAVCSSCHVGHDPVASESCAVAGCHAGFKVTAGQANCWTCHDPGQDMSAVGPGSPATCTVACHRASDPTGTVAGTPHDPHPERTTCTASGCHTVSSAASANGSPHHALKAPAPTTVNLKVGPTSIRLGKTVKAGGAVTPVNLGGTVILTVQWKKGGRFVTVKTVKRSVSTTGKYSYTYKPGKKGAYQVRAVVKAREGFAGSKSRLVRFTVK